jgi:mono/diheme cytochrome c family protein
MGRVRSFTITIAIVTCLAVSAFYQLRPASAQIKREALRPGLIATHRDNAEPKPVEIVQLEPAVTLALKANESPHPQLAAGGGVYRWEGYINVLRAADYQFSAHLRGKLRLRIADKNVFVAEVLDQRMSEQKSAPVRLEAGVHALSAEFVRLPGEARLLLFWQAPHFYAEPLPHSVLRHLPEKAPAALKANRQSERGRFLVEELGCASCHRPGENDKLAAGLHTRQAPDLSTIGQRVSIDWLHHWLSTPALAHPGRLMPQMFGADEAGRTESYAVASYLAKLGGPIKVIPKPPAPKEAKSIERGRKLFTSVGCIVCHNDKGKEAKGTQEQTALYPASLPAPALDCLAGKTTPDKLAAFLANPLATHPGGRMPNMLLDAKESLDLANYLIFGTAQKPVLAPPKEPAPAQRLAAFKRVDPRPAEMAAFQRLNATEQWLDLGKRLAIDRGCNNCHTIAPGGQPFANVYAAATFDDIKDAKKHAAGCLTEAPKDSAPRFSWSPSDRQAVQAFLREGTNGTGSPSAAHAARVTLQRFNCLACHARDGEGGLSEGMIQELRKFEKVENAEALTPPPLTEVGRKLRMPWLSQVLTEAGRARPWMSLRMPQFGTAHVGKLPEALAALDGTEPDSTIHAVKLTPQKIETGRHLVGKGAFACIACHDIAGIPNHGTRGPDLALMSQRVRYDWYRRWLESAQRMQPGTKMPTVFPDGKSTVENVHNGNADLQADAMWAYLAQGPTLQLPEGMEPPKGLIVQVGGRPELVRTFLQDAGTKAVAVGYPGGISTAFDATTCRLAFAWTGNFLDVTPVWGNRGGAPAKVLGLRFWTAPAGFPWALNRSSEPPDFSSRAKDPAFGGPVPDGKVHNGPQRVFFDGYTLDKGGMPTFRYHLENDDGTTVSVSERPEPLRNLTAVGLARHFEIAVPAQRSLWFFAGETAKAPRRFSKYGHMVPWAFGAKHQQLSATGLLVALSQTGERVHVLAASGVPATTVWHFEEHGAGWRVYLTIPPAAARQRVQFRVDFWTVLRDEANLVQELVKGQR